ncbi:class I SAM-dependent methyltransferase [Planotetraspora phitsanulokensis]|uniref:Putative methyltransferase n=1 Tax=Planotetraspora phitsanulokensis TaxID=575192 RepID=A0A8J3U3V0_9ACTN|nr:methyltransferase domain-containing protein [Planotetraspora phitsanulokensis]GII36492.1 putative methyltransferase [Planotetraspora phitsanulokensis]
MPVISMGEDEQAGRTADDVAVEGDLAALRRLTKTISAMETRRTAIIEELRGQGRASWEEIGRACGMTRQGATRRWSRRLQAGSFGIAAEAYHRGRPGYPLSSIEWLIPRSARRVLDLGAGTGKFTRLLVDAGLKVFAVEPSEGMRARLSASVPAAVVREGSAEHIPLQDGSVDAVVVAQAWHWVDPDLAVPEVARVLVPGGTLALVWNIRDNDEPWVADLDGILHQHTRQAIDTQPSVGEPFGRPERLEIRWTQVMTRAELLDMVASRSYVIALPDLDRQRLLGEVEELLDSHPDLKGRSEITMPYITRCTRVRRH